MAAPRKLTKNSPTPARRTPTPREEISYGGHSGNMAENIADDNPTHLMPSVQAGGHEQTIGEPSGNQDGVDDLSPEELAKNGYPDPANTPEDSMGSTRDKGPFKAQMENRVAETHKLLDEKLDSINNRTDNYVKLTEDNPTDFADLPNAPKGDDVLILGPDEPVRVSGEERDGGIELDKRVYRAQRPFRSKRWNFVLVHPKGAFIPIAQIRSVQQPTGTEPSTTEETKEAKTATADGPIETPHDAK